jgi:hypothetical protein
MDLNSDDINVLGMCFVEAAGLWYCGSRVIVAKHRPRAVETLDQAEESHSFITCMPKYGVALR